MLSGSLSDEHFAADLDHIVRDPASYPVYGDPDQFFALTHPTKGLRDLLARTFGRVSGAKGIAGTEKGVLRPQTSFGGGKTHGLIALYHLAQGAKPANLDRFAGAGSNQQTLVSITSTLVSDIRAKINQAQAEAVRLTELDDRADVGAAEGAFADAVTLEEIERTLTSNAHVHEQLTPHPSLDGVSQVKDDIGFTRNVTFDRRILDELSPDVRLLAPGDPLFDLVIRRASAPPAT